MSSSLRTLQFPIAIPTFPRLALLVLLALLGVSRPAAQAAPVSFWFGGFISYLDDSSNAAPFPLAVGQPFTGRISYDPALATGSASTNSNGRHGNYYFDTLEGFSFLLQINGQVITNTFQPGVLCGLSTINDGISSNDELLLETSGGTNLKLNGTNFTTYPQISYASFELGDNTRTALSHAGLPATPPDLAKFKSLRELRWGIAVDDGIPTSLLTVVGTITSVRAGEVVMLGQKQLSKTVQQLSWPTLHSGYLLQSTTNLANPNWQNVTNTVVDTNRLHTVNVPATGPQRYFRLRK